MPILLKVKFCCCFFFGLMNTFFVPKGWQVCAELQIRGGIENNSKIIFLISQSKHVVTPHQNCLDERVLMMDHKICFYGKIWLIISKLSLLPLLNWSTAICLQEQRWKTGTNQPLL